MTRMTMPAVSPVAVIAVSLVVGAAFVACGSEHEKGGAPPPGADASVNDASSGGSTDASADGASADGGTAAGDGGLADAGSITSPPLETVFPPAQFANAQTDCGAKGDGVTDDTAALNACLATRSVFFPVGTYLVSDTLAAPQCYRIYQGENRDGTILKLKDDAGGGFAQADAAGGDAKPVIQTVDDPQAMPPGNQAFDNFIVNLTVDTGKGNPNAAAIAFHANNEGAIRSVVLRSGDGQGRAGLDLAHSYPGPSLVEYVEIDGFDYGVLAGEPQYGVTFEHLRLNGQRLAGIVNGGAGTGGQTAGNMLNIRDLVSSNSVPAVVSAPPGFITLLGGTLTGGDPGAQAIVNNAQVGSLYLQNVTTSGYGAALSNRGAVVPGSAITELIDTPDGGPSSSFPLTPSRAPIHSLGLPVAETPFFHDNDLSTWQDVGAPSGTDDTTAIQNALDSGKPTIFFHGEHGPDGGNRLGWYRVRDTLHVPATVKRIVGMETFITQATGNVFTAPDGGSDPLKPVFRFEGGTAGDTVYLERLNFTWLGGSQVNCIVLDDATPRTLVIRDVAFGGSTGLGDQGEIFGYSNEPGAGPAFFSDVVGLATFPNAQTAWMRHYNNEDAYSSSPSWDHTVNAGGTLWILGFKTEKAGQLLETTDGGRSELFGGFFYPSTDDSVNNPSPTQVPAFVVKDAQASFSFVEQVDSAGASYDTFVEEEQAGVTRTFTPAMAGVARGPKGGNDVSLYVSKSP